MQLNLLREIIHSTTRDDTRPRRLDNTNSDPPNSKMYPPNSRDLGESQVYSS